MAGPEREIKPEKTQMPLTETQLEDLVKQSVGAATMTAEAVARATMDTEFPHFRKSVEEMARITALNAIARQKKVASMKAVGINVGTSLAVFIAGTLTLAGVQRYRDRDRNRDQNQGNNR